VDNFETKGEYTSWMNEKISYFKGLTHISQAAPTVCRSNETHYLDFRDDESALEKARDVECGRMIQELWLSRCEESLQACYARVVHNTESLHE
jgi:hypothetical protein